MTYRIRNITVAVALAVVAALLTTFYVANYKRHVRQSESTVKVYVATRDIPQGTPGADIVDHSMMSVQDVAQRTVVPGAISSPDQIRTLLTTQAIYAGEQVTERRFAGNAEQGVRSLLHGNLRAVALAGTDEALLAGTLKDGDHVDVIADLKTGSCITCVAARVVGRDLLVLRAAQSSATKVGGQNSSVLLAARERKTVQQLWFAVQNSSGWTLALRPVAGAVDSPEDVENLGSVLKDNVSAKNLHGTKVGQ
jgi:Flp pilus assembly protein CpaB